MFHALKCNQLSELRTMGIDRLVESGAPLFHQGDRAGQVYTLVAGSLRLYRLMADGRRQITGFNLPGDFIGMALGTDHEMTAEALEPARLWAFERSRFEDYVNRNAVLKDSLLDSARHELAAAQQQFIVLGRKTAMERVASFLLDLHQRYERIVGHDVAHMALPMSRADIADYLGLTKETVSRVLSQLRNRRLVRLVTLTCVELLDVAALEGLAEGA